MRINLFGAGYVGLVTAACLAEHGNQVLCIDIDQEKVKRLKQGECPIHEPDLPALLQKNLEAGRLNFSHEPEEGVHHGFYQFITVGTPQDEDGSADLSHVLEVAQTIGASLTEPRLIINKSTVPVGTADKVSAAIQKQLTKRKLSIAFDVASNPEFLREGAAVNDFMRSDRIIIGTDSSDAENHLRQLYKPFNRNNDRLIAMDIRSAELTKYAANAFLATKISFINEISRLAERLNADIEQIRIGIGSDPRIGYHFINPGAGYGGSCFPKDVLALEATAKSFHYTPLLINAVHKVNDAQKRVLFEKITHHFNNKLSGKTIALWGLSFKPNTDDMREAPSRVLIDAALKAGMSIQAYDPVAMPEAQRLYKTKPNFSCCESPEAALINANALVIVTEWNLFFNPDFENIKQQLKEPTIFDGRNLYDPHYLKQLGFNYYGIGRGEPFNP
ncbi:UDP-glucose dehydrogenase family protein [Rickettsiella endosymbiont of Dermanyssus gallinae]|uniref:UDP-glucose dehydrogenase family protein n=1 Tax=Rickettsiella endosymbiont of Dermanyssus gallinae TaxID=2856608 RepID=UPI001C527E8F|nr:UDP-glucose/GDP-mannose dehydrogenase family protein [Rickettsiella endosymbiont of Dermanyssus gallinae]